MIDVLILLAALALAGVLVFRLGVRYARRRHRNNHWPRRVHDGIASARPKLPNSSPVADDAPGDHPAGVNSPATPVPPAGADVIEGSHRGIETGYDIGMRTAAEFFPQHRGR